MMFNKYILPELKKLDLRHQFITLDDVMVLETMPISRIEEIDSKCDFTLQKGMWYVVKVEEEGNPNFSEDRMKILNIGTPNIMTFDRLGNRLFFFFDNSAFTKCFQNVLMKNMI